MKTQKMFILQKTTFKAPTRNKSKLMRKIYMEQAVQEVFKDDINPPSPGPLDYKSVTAKDFNIEGFQHIPPKPTKNDNYRTEQPVSFWSDHKDKVTGVSSIKTRDTSFRKNDAFSQPIDEYFDDTQPYDQEIIQKCDDYHTAKTELPTCNCIKS